MDLQNAINKGYTMKFTPPNLKFVIGELKSIQEMLGLEAGLPFTDEENDIELSVQAVEGIFGLLENIGDKITKIAQEEVSQQIDDAPEPDPEIRKQKQEDEKAPEPAQPSTDSEAGE